MNRVIIAFSVAALLAAAPLAQAHAHCANGDGQAEGCVELGTVVVDHLELADPWARAMQPGQPAGGGYLRITNHGDTPDRLVHAHTARAARVEIHAMSVVDDVMTMRPVEGGLDVPAGETVALEPGGYHIMFFGVADPFREGERLEVTLEFEQAGRVALEFPVRGMGHGRGHDHEYHGHAHDHEHDNGHSLQH
jgi:periplasmic copper chaperone A